MLIWLLRDACCVFLTQRSLALSFLLPDASMRLRFQQKDRSDNIPRANRCKPQPDKISSAQVGAHMEEVGGTKFFLFSEGVHIHARVVGHPILH